MTGIFTNFLTDVVNDALVTINSGLHSTLVDVLRIETLLESVTVISAEAIEALYWYTYTLVSVLVVLKFLWKGFSKALCLIGNQHVHVDFDLPAYKLELMGKGGGR